ncbi:MAG: hypothetical protein WC658_05245 [Candidatus Omnitrophota bacterium]
MNFQWESEKEKLARGLKISPESKLEGMRLMNELADSVLTKHQKRLRQRLRAI